MATLLSKVSGAVAACARRVSRATRRALLRARRLRRDNKQLAAPAADHQQQEAGDDDDDGGGLWRRAILMGQRCKPLDFPGAIHYDSFGRRLPAPPPSRRGKKAAGALLLCRSADAVDAAVVTAAPKKAKYV
ncbi:hypothetical protein ACP4OV_027663 [Aristida adscensionis]